MRLTRRVIFLFAFAVAAGAVFGFSTPRAGAGSEDSATAYARTYPMRFVNVASTHVKKGLPFFVSDMDGDGNDDLLLNRENSVSWCRLHGSTMTLVRECSFEGRGSAQMVADVDGDGRPEFFVFRESPKGWMFSCHDWFSQDGPSVPVYTVGPFYPRSVEGGNPSKKTRFFGSFACPGGCRRMILVGSNPNSREGDRRSLLAYDGETGRELWRFDFGPLSSELLCDCFGSSTPRIVLTTIANGNGLSANGTNDFECYLFCLDQRTGDLLWRKKLGGMGARAYVASFDVNADGRNELCVARYLPEKDSVLVADPHAWNVATFDAEGTLLAGVQLPVRPGPLMVTDIDGDSSPELLVDAIGGKLLFLERDLAIQRVMDPPPSRTAQSADILCVRDLVGNREPEIVSSMDREIVVRDRKGGVIARSSYQFKPFVDFLRCGGRDYVAAAHGDTLDIMKLQPLPLVTRLRAHSRRLMIGTAAAVFIAVLVMMQGRLFLRWWREKRMTFEEEQNELLTAMSAFGHGGSSLRVLDRLRFQLKNWGRIRTDGVAKEELFARLHQTYRETVVPELERIVMLARKAHAPEGSWSTLLAEAKRADGEIVEILASGSEGARQEAHIAKGLEALDGVDESIAAIRSHLRAVFRTPVAEALDRLLARFRYEQGDGGVSFALAPEAASAGAVFMSPLSFDKVFEQLLSNAVRATDGRAGAAVAVAIQTEGNYCQIDVRDNGCGIAREHWDHIFDRHFSSKPEGGGFGLYYAREELAKFGGKIFVADSVVGSGTTIRAVLRKSERAGAA